MEKETKSKEECERRLRWLGRYRAAADREQALAEEIVWLRGQAEQIRTALTPGGAGQEPEEVRVPRAVQQLEAVCEELEIQVENCLALRAQIAHSIAALPDARWRETLHRRFLLGQSQAEAAKAMHVSLRSLQRFQTEAVRALELPQTEKSA